MDGFRAQFQVVDLSIPLENGMPVPGSLPPVRIEPLLTHEKPLPGSKRSVALLQIALTEHVGTHLDAPFHFAPEGMPVDALPLELLVLQWGRLIDVTHRGDREVITPDDLLRAESNCGHLRPGEAAFLHTGYWRYWGSERYFQAPHLAVDTAKELLARGICLLAIDALTVDDTRGSERPVHDLLLRDAGILILEGVTNLDRVTVNPFHFIALPLRIRGGSGSPVRLVAVLPAQNTQP